MHCPCHSSQFLWSHCMYQCQYPLAEHSQAFWASIIPSHDTRTVDRADHITPGSRQLNLTLHHSVFICNHISLSTESTSIEHTRRNGIVHHWTSHTMLMMTMMLIVIMTGHNLCSCQVVDYLLWASMCLESSITLVTVNYLSWRSTLYAAVCQCYCDLKQYHMSEVLTALCIRYYFHIY